MSYCELTMTEWSTLQVALAQQMRFRAIVKLLKRAKRRIIDTTAVYYAVPSASYCPALQRDRMGLPTVVRYPDGTTEQFEYDGEGNLTRYVNPTGEETRYAYDGKGLPVERINAAGFRLAYQYDTQRRLSRLTNQNGEQKL